MVSLSILVGSTAALIALDAWIITLLARRVGSTRARLSTGFMAIFGIVIINILLAVVSMQVPAGRLVAELALGLILLFIQLAAALAIMKRLFALSTTRALAPFGGYLAMIVAQGAIALMIIRPFLVESMHVPTVGMAPTIQAGSRFLVNKIIEPRRLDIVAFWNTADPPIMFCQRLIALPGERLRLSGGNVYINDQAIDLPPALAGKCRMHLKRIHGMKVDYADDETIVLAEDEYFFIGDNVEQSADSRMYGPTKRSAFVGVIDCVYWPLTEFKVMR